MSLKKPIRFLRTITFRLTAWYSLILIASVLLLFLIAYFFIYTSIQDRDRAAILSRLRELTTLYQTGGADLLEKNIRINKKFHNASNFFIRLADPNNKTIFISLPYQWAEFDIKELEENTPSQEKQFIRLCAREGPTHLTVASIRLHDGYWLQVGKSNEERLKILERFREVLGVVILPLIFVGFIGGGFLAYSALKPIRHLIHTVRSISQDIEKMEDRVPNPGSNDELEELVTLFNNMLEKISTLINAMKNSLDHVAHDLRTPMTRLRGIAEVAMQTSSSQEQCKEALADCIEESERILKLVDTVLDISEAETGVMKLDLQEVDLGIIINKIVDLYQYVADAKLIKINSSIEKGLLTRVDPTRIGQVVANLVDNAVKYTPGNGSIFIKAWKNYDEIFIEITDSGLGIPEEDLPRIWDRLYRGDHSRSEKGLGLGLTFVKAIIELHGGQIEVSSEPGKGSTFTIRLSAIASPISS